MLPRTFDLFIGEAQRGIQIVAGNGNLAGIATEGHVVGNDNRLRQNQCGTISELQRAARGQHAVAVGVVLTLLSSAGMGILSASFILYFKRGDPINFLLSGATTFLGGVFFPVQQLPQSVQFLSEYLPINWSLQIVRGALLQGKSFWELREAIAHLTVLTAILLPLGLIASRVAIRRAKREGSLVQY